MFLHRAVFALLLPFLVCCQPKEEKTHTVECGMTERQLSEAQLAGRTLVDFHPLGGDRVCAVFATEAGLTTATAAEKKTYKAYRDCDDPVRGMRAQLYALAAKHPEIMKLEVLGHSHQKREVLGVRLTSPAPTAGKKGQVLYVGLHHAREWVTADLMMRYLRHLLDGAASDPETQLALRQTEIWLVPILNPDGYQYTFDTNRMWRKNLRDNDGDGRIGEEDGVDLNRNYDFQWGYDEYGASDKPRSGTYRGPSAFSEPETAALRDLFERQKFSYAISFHSFGNLILYPSGYRPFVAPPDQPVFEYLAGTPEKSAVYDSANGKYYRAGAGSSLYTTNGDFDDWAYHSAGVFPFTVELTNLKTGFDFPDDEVLLERLFRDNLSFMTDVLKSSRNRSSPVSHLREGTLKRLVHQSPAKPLGGTQELEVLARKGAVVSVEHGKDVGKAFSAQRFEIIEPGILFDRLTTKLRRLGTGDEIKYRLIVREGGLRFSAPEDGYHVFKVQPGGASGVLFVSASALPETTTAYVRTLEGLGFANRFDTYVARSETVTNAEILSRYPVVIWHMGSGERDPASRQLLELSKYVRAGGALYLAGSPQRSALYDESDNTMYNFFNYDLGIDAIVGDSIELSAQPKTVEVPAADPIFGGLRFSLAAEKGNVKYPLLVKGLDPEARAVLPQSLPLLAALSSERGGYSYVEFPVEIPMGEGAAELLLSYQRSAWEMYFFVEIQDPETGTWSSLDGPQVRELDNGLQSDCASWKSVAAHLESYFDDTCAFRRDAAGKPLLKNLFFRDKWSDVSFDLGKMRGKSFNVRVSALSRKGLEGAVLLRSARLKVGEKALPLSPHSVSNAWDTNAGLDLPLVVARSQSIYFPIGLEHLTTDKTREEVLARILSYLGLR